MVSKDINFEWKRPAVNSSVITLREAIGHLPSLDPLVREENKREYFPDYEHKREHGLKISKWHYPPTHSWHHRLCINSLDSSLYNLVLKFSVRYEVFL